MKNLLGAATFLATSAFGYSDEIVGKGAMLRKRKIATTNKMKTRKAEKRTLALFTTQNATNHNPNEFLDESPIVASLQLVMSIDNVSPKVLEDQPPSHSPSLAPIESSSPTHIGHCKDPDLRDSLILARLMTTSSIAALQDKFSPQFKAYRWILRADSLQLGACDKSLIQRYVLVILHNQLDGNSWDKSADWLTGTSECMWANVVCQSQAGDDGEVYDAVTELNFGNNNMQGDIPEEIVNLEFLEHFHINSNFISGPIPDSIGDLSRLKSLDIYQNNINGFIPDSLYRLANLEVLDISSNRFVGTLSADLGRLSKLEFLAVANTTISGEIPANIGALRNLKNLIMYSNNFKGIIPPAIGELNQLVYLDLRDNGLSGPLPGSIYGLPSLSALYLGSNELEGSISSLLGDLTSLQVLMLESNNFTSSIPVSLSTLSNLETLNLTQNHFDGPLPESMDNLSKLETMDVSNNWLNGTVSSELFGIDTLQVLYMSNNTFSGEIAPEFQDFKGVDLFLDGNNFTGKLPEIEPGNLGILEEFLLNGNNLEGEVPDSLCALAREGILEDLWTDCSSSEIACNCCTACF